MTEAPGSTPKSSRTANATPIVQPPTMLASNDVVEVSANLKLAADGTTFVVQDFVTALGNLMGQYGLAGVPRPQASGATTNPSNMQWFSTDGVACRVLQAKRPGWQVGTVYLTLAFVAGSQEP